MINNKPSVKNHEITIRKHFFTNNVKTTKKFSLGGVGGAGLLQTDTSGSNTVELNDARISLLSGSSGIALFSQLGGTLDKRQVTIQRMSWRYEICVGRLANSLERAQWGIVLVGEGKYGPVTQSVDAFISPL